MELLFEFEPEYDEKGIFGKDPEKDLAIFMAEIEKSNSDDYDLDLLRDSFYYCVESHKHITRKSGYPYYTHPLNVALILLKEFPVHDTESLAASFLHDTIEDVEGIQKSSIDEAFGTEIAEIVDGVTKISGQNMKSDHLESESVNKAETYRKIFLALVRDVRVILIKLADRLHNMRTLHYLKPEKQKSISMETINFYIPLAHRLGLGKIKTELENRSFYYSDRSTYEAIRSALNEKRRDFIDYIRVFVDLIQNSLHKHNIKHMISIIHKHEYEIYQMIQSGKSISDIDNFYSLVIIIESDDVHECYRAHGILANAFSPISYIDYISNPKMDWYQSLNTQLIGPDGKRVDILIRTQEMEKIAEEGFASQFALKTGRIKALQFTEEEIDGWGEWMKSIIEDKGDDSLQIIWDSIKVNLFDSDLTLYTKEGTAVTLPEGANIIDFAFAISVEQGMHCISGKVNGVVKDIYYKLKTGDQIEIIASENVLPKPEWLKSVVTHRAVVNLYNFFKDNPAYNSKSISDIVGTQNVMLNIRGDDREGMLLDITDAIGKVFIKRIHLDNYDNSFAGKIIVTVKNNTELNKIFVRLLSISGVKSVIKDENADI